MRGLGLFDAADCVSPELIVTFGVPGPRGCRTLGGVWLEMTGLPPPVPERVGGILSGEAEELETVLGLGAALVALPHSRGVP